MSDGISAYWDDVEQREEKQQRAFFLQHTDRAFILATDALDQLRLLQQTNPQLTKQQHQLLDQAVVHLRKCFS